MDLMDEAKEQAADVMTDATAEHAKNKLSIGK
jgi:hypothetical protein